MIYDISVNVHSPYVHKTIEAKDEKEAEEVVAALAAEKRMEINPTTINISTSVRLSDDNFRYVSGGIYLIKRWSSHLPAKCIRSYRTYGRKKFEHIFRYLESGREIALFGQNPTRVIGKLCNDGKINRPECDNCVAKFGCYTIKGRI